MQSANVTKLYLNEELFVITSQIGDDDFNLALIDIYFEFGNSSFRHYPRGSGVFFPKLILQIWQFKHGWLLLSSTGRVHQSICHLDLYSCANTKLVMCLELVLNKRDQVALVYSGHVCSEKQLLLGS